MCANFSVSFAKKSLQSWRLATTQKDKLFYLSLLSPFSCLHFLFLSSIPSLFFPSLSPFLFVFLPVLLNFSIVCPSFFICLKVGQKYRGNPRVVSALYPRIPPPPSTYFFSMSIYLLFVSTYVIIMLCLTHGYAAWSPGAVYSVLR